MANIDNLITEDKFIVKENSPWHKFDLNRIKDIKRNRYCSGCSACYCSCKSNAIYMKEDSDGFMKPVVDESKCTNCGKCNKVCPIINFKYTNNIDNLKIYAAQSKKELCNSSSGGVFSILAKHIINQGGYVCGVKFSEDHVNVEHTIISSLDELEKIQLSKYVQSDLKDVFKQVKKLLQLDKFVLFSGTSCQVNGLKKYLGKTYENLFTVDFICNGAPSRKVWRMYLDECVKNDVEEKIEEVKFRLKDQGWYSRAIKIKTNKREYRIPNSKSIYQQAFFRGLSINRICTVCPYDTLSRNSDITLGDYWGIKGFDPKLDNDLGTSYIAVNSPKGKEFLNNVISEFSFIKETPFDWNLVVNTNSIRPIRHHNREQFFFYLDKIPLNDNYSRCIRDYSDCIIYNHAITDYNYGSVLTAYAIQEVITELGYFAKILNTQRIKYPNYVGSFGHRFARDYLHLTEITQAEDDFVRLNSKSDIFLVGSDQVWRAKYWRQDLNRILFNFLETGKKKIGIAASFGVDEFEGTEEQFAYFKRELKKFTKISVREASGVDICKKSFGVEAKWILDPVFILSKEYFENMIEESNYDCSNKIVYYGWNFKESYEYLLKLKKYLRADDVIDITGKKLLVEDWLKAIKTAKFVVSNSYHGICFSLIFNKNIVCVNDIGEGRFESLAQLFPIKQVMVKNINEVFRDNEIILEKINYEIVNQVIKEERIKSLDFIKSIFE